MSRRHSRLKLSLLESRITPDNTLIYAATNARDLVWDNVRNHLYITTSVGAIRMYNAASGILSDLVTIPGGSLNGADITTDSSSLFVTDSAVIDGKGQLHRVDLATKGVTTLNYTPDASEIGSWDVAVVSLGLGMLTTQYSGSGSVPFRDLNVIDNTLTQRLDVPTLRQNSTMSRAADYSRMALAEANLGTGPLRAYTSTTDSFSPALNTGSSLTSSRSTVSRDGQLVAVEVGSSVNVYSAADNTLVKSLANLSGGIAFDPARDRLYGVDATANEIVCFRVDTWQEMYRRPAGQDVGSSNILGSGVMTVAGDVAYLITVSGVRKIDLPTPATGPDHLRMSVLPSFTQAGYANTFTVEVLYADNTPVTNYSGTIALNSSDVTATLPPSYTFVAADQGLKSLAVAFNLAGTHDLTITGVNLAPAFQSGIKVHTAGLGDSLSIPIIGARDAVFDAGRHRLYVSTDHGTIERFDTQNLTLLSPWQVGINLYGIDLTPNGLTILAADAPTGGSNGIIRRVDADTGAVTSISYTGDNGTYDIAAFNNNMALLTARRSIAESVSLRQLDLTTNVVTVRSDVPAVFRDSRLSRSADGSRGFLFEANTLEGTARIYSSAGNSFSQGSALRGYNNDSQAAVSRNGQAVALETHFAASLFGPAFQGFDVFPGIDGGMAFDPLLDRLYGINPTTEELIAYDTATWRERYRLPLGIDANPTVAFGEGVMCIGGNAAFLITPSGIRRTPLPSGGAASKIVVSGLPAFLPAGHEVTMIVSAKAADEVIDTNFTGTVSFSGLGGALILPANYTFTLADQGTKAFPVTFNAQGTFSVMATAAGLLSLAQNGIQVHSFAPGTSVSVPMLGGHDLAFDDARGMLYVSTDRGTIERFSPSTMTLLAPWKVGANLYGMDITPDGASLIVADRQGAATGGFIRRVNLDTGSVASLPYVGDFGTYDIAAFSNNLAIFTPRYDSFGSSNLRQLNLSTNVISVRADVSNIQQDSRIARSADRSRALFMEANISSGPIRIYTTASNSFGSAFAAGGYNFYNQATVSRNGAVIAMGFPPTLSLFSPTFAPIEGLMGIDGGASFDPLLDRLYGINSSTDQVISYDTATWRERLRLPLGVDVGTSAGFGSGVTAVGGGVMSLIVGSDVRCINLPTSGSATALKVMDTPAFLPAGMTTTVTVTARTADGGVDANFTGTVTLSVSGGSATLPPAYTFVPADQGTKELPLTFTSDGTMTVTASAAGLTQGAQAGIQVHDLTPGAATTIPIVGPRDLAYDKGRNLLYVSTDHGTIERFDPVSMTLLPAWQVGINFFGIDVSADGNSLLAADVQWTATGNFIRRVDLNTGSVTTIGYQGDDGAYDIAAFPNGWALFTSRHYGTSSVGLRQLNLANNVISVRTDWKSTTQDTRIARAADGSVALFLEANISSGPMRLYTSASNSFGTSLLTNDFHDANQFAVSRDGQLLASEFIGGGVSVFAPNYQPIENLLALDGGVTFDPIRDRLYALSAATDQLVAFDAGTWRERYRLPAGFDVTPSNGFGLGITAASGTDLFAIGATGVRRLPLPSANPAAVRLSVEGFPAYLPVGTSAPFTVSARTADNSIATDFTGTVTLSASGAASLPAGYEFTAADLGRKTFMATFNSAGSFSLSAASSGISQGTQSGIAVHDANPVTVIPVADYRGMVFDTARDLLYISTPRGVIERYSPTTQTLLPSIFVGGVLTGIDISPDGNRLLAADSLHHATGGFVRTVDLVNDKAGLLTYSRNSNEGGLWDIAVLGNGKALFTSQGSLAPFRQIELATNIISQRSDVANVGNKSMLSRGVDRSVAVLSHSDNLSGPFSLYRSLSNDFSASVNTNANLSNAPSAVNRNSSLAALEVGSDVQVYSSSLALAATLQGANAGMVFDPIQDRIYAANSTNQITVYDTKSWANVGNIAVPASVPASTAFNSETMAISDDGRWLFLEVNGGIFVRRLVVPTATNLTIVSTATAGQPLSIKATISGGKPSERSGQPVTFVNGATTLGTAPLDMNGTATLNLLGLDAGSYSIVASYPGDVNYLGSTSPASPLVVSPPVGALNVQVADGLQRSVVRSVTVTFGGNVTLAPGAGTIERLGAGGGTVSSFESTVSIGGQSVSTFTFTGGFTEFTSLIDGLYRLTLNASAITDANGAPIDGDGDGQSGGNVVFDFHRLFGDSDGDRDVDINDFAAFRMSFGGSNTIFDFDNDGDVDAGDFGHFRQRFGVNI